MLARPAEYFKQLAIAKNAQTEEHNYSPQQQSRCANSDGGQQPNTNRNRRSTRAR